MESKRDCSAEATSRTKFRRIRRAIREAQGKAFCFEEQGLTVVLFKDDDGAFVMVTSLCGKNDTFSAEEGVIQAWNAFTKNGRYTIIPRKMFYAFPEYWGNSFWGFITPIF